MSLLQRDFKVWDAKSQACFYFAPPPKPRLLLQKTQAAAPAPPNPAPQNTLWAQKRLWHHPAEVLVCLERGATGPYFPRYIANTPVGHCEATAATAGRSRPLQIQNLRPLGRPITTRATPETTRSTAVGARTSRRGMAPAVRYVVTPNRVSQLEGQKQGITRFGFTGAHDILERTTPRV